MDKAKFFDEVRKTVFGGSLTADQVKGMEGIIDACEHFGVTDKRQVAYILATPMIETGGKFVPITENLNYSADGLLRTFPKYFSPASVANQYARQPEKIANRAYANRMGNGPESSGDGWKYRGRGMCQITGHDNYKKFSDIIGVSFVDHPEMATDFDHASQIIVTGMRDGVFTGKKLSDYIHGSTTDYVNARKIINGLDRAQDIAGYAKKFEAAIDNA